MPALPPALLRPAAGVAPSLRRCGPLLVLLAALATLFPLFNESGPLHRLAQSHDDVSFDHLAVARNLAAEHGWLGFYWRKLERDGEVSYSVYHRFPPAGYLLIRLAILTQPGDLWGQIQAARMLMLALFAGAAVLAYASLVLITGRRWLPAAATLAAFCSFTALRSCDLVATEGVVDLFGTMLAFHGIARYCFPGEPGVPSAPGERPRFGQMLAKACVALLLGWHVYALLAPFVALGAVAALAGRNWAEFRRLALFGGLVLLFGLAVMAQNLAREHVGLGGRVPIWELPSFGSARRRIVYRDMGDGMWWEFVAVQLQRLGLALVPYAASRVHLLWSGWALAGALGLATICGVALAAAGGWGFRNRGAVRRQMQGGCLALVPLAVAGHVWATGVRGNLVSSYRFPGRPGTGEESWDIFEALFHVGAPLALFSLLGLLPAAAALRHIPQPLRRAAAAVCVAALWLAFVASAFHMGRLGSDAETARQERALHADLDAIRRALTGGSVLYIPRGPSRLALRWRRGFYFADHVLVTGIGRAEKAEFAVAARIPGARTLTPDNRGYFLYGMEEYRRYRGPPWRIVGQVPGRLKPLPSD